MRLVPQQVVTITAGAGGADAAAILTELAGSAATGYTFAEDGGALKITRGDGVNFAVSAGEASGSGDAASGAVAETTNGSVAVVCVRKSLRFPVVRKPIQC